MSRKRNWKSRIFLPWIGLLTTVSIAWAGGSTVITWDSNHQITVKNANSNTAVRVDPDGVVIVGTGDGPRNAVISFPGSGSSKPDEPRTQLPPPIGDPLEIKDSKGFLIGGMAEVGLNKKIYITSRHVLQDYDYESLKASFKAENLDISQYEFFQFNQGNEVLDVILAVPKEISSQLFEDKELTRLSLSDKSQWRTEVHPNDPFYASHFSTIGTDDPKAVSTGLISEVSGTRFYLPNTADNFSTYGSSGSIVWTRPAQSPANAPKGEDAGWRISGVIECVVRDRAVNEIKIRGATRVIPFSVIQKAKASPIFPEALVREKRVFHPDCGGVDRRDGGGA